MEEKKVIKISLPTLFLIISIIIIIAMGVCIYKLYIDKSAEIQKSTELQAQVNNLNGTIDDLQEKINKISETINSNNTTEETNNNSISFTDEQIKTAISNYIDLYAHGGCDSILENLTEKGNIKYDSSKNKDQNDGQIVTNVKYSDYKNAMLNYVSENEFEKNWTKKQNFSQNSNGYLTKIEGGGGLAVYTIKNITKTGELSYSVKATYYIEEEKEITGEDNFNFVITSNNGKCVVDSFQELN